MANTDPCWSEPARDGGVSADINAGCAGLIASELAPTGYIGPRHPLPKQTSGRRQTGALFRYQTNIDTTVGFPPRLGVIKDSTPIQYSRPDLRNHDHLTNSP